MESGWLVGLLPFQNVGQQNLVEAFGDVSRDEVNLVLSTFDFQLLKVVTDGSLVVITNLVRVNLCHPKARCRQGICQPVQWLWRG